MITTATVADIAEQRHSRLARSRGYAGRRLEMPIEKLKRLVDRAVELGAGPAVLRTDQELDAAGDARGAHRIGQLDRLACTGRAGPSFPET